MTWEPIGLTLLAVLPYVRAVKGEFLFDDPYLFVVKRKTGKLPIARRYFYLREFRGDQRAMLHIFDGWLWRIFQASPTGTDETGTVITQPATAWHVLSLAFHIGTTLTVWGLAGLFLEPWRALASAAIFAVHPLQVGAVAYISGRAGVQAAFFSALGLLHAASGGWHWLAVPVCQYFAYKSKPDALLYLAFYPLILWHSI